MPEYVDYTSLLLSRSRPALEIKHDTRPRLSAHVPWRYKYITLNRPMKGYIGGAIIVRCDSKV